MAKQNRKFDLNKGGGDNKFDLNKGTGRKFDLSKDMDDDELAMAEETPAAEEAPKSVIEPAQVPQPEEPASVLEPEITPERVADAIEYGPEEPKKKGFAWLWALIGIAVVLAVLGMVFLRGGEKEKAATEPVENVAESPDVDSAVAEEEEAAETDEAAPEASAPAQSESPASAEADSPASAASAEAAAPAAESSAAPEAAPAPAAKSAPSLPTAPKASAVDQSAQPTGSVKEEAKNVIKGIYGDGSERKNRLGDRYKEIQRRVNKMKRSGKF